MAAVYAIVPAAGLGTRMQASTGSTPKQFLMLGGRPILISSLLALGAVPRVAGIWVAVRPGEQARLATLLADHAAELPRLEAAELPRLEAAKFPRITVVEGGDTRQESVARALAAIPCEDADIVLVHDAVRPLVEPAAVERMITAIEKHGAAILALPATDTIKQVDRTAHGALITATIPRENIVQAQTPQGARAALLRRAFSECAADGFYGTDEASLLERAGIPVAVVPGAVSNLKITQAADLPLAEWYLAQRIAKTNPGGEIR
jgi:2-C-methyl-D-erythritol 4-phosphate cytidylyltransferase